MPSNNERLPATLAFGSLREHDALGRGDPTKTWVGSWRGGRRTTCARHVGNLHTLHGIAKDGLTKLRRGSEAPKVGVSHQFEKRGGPAPRPGYEARVLITCRVFRRQPYGDRYTATPKDE